MTDKKKRKVPQPLKVEKKRKAMLPPMCRLCETRHWANQGHHFAGSADG